MRVAITGSGGQVGGAVTKLLADRHDVLALSHDELDVSDFDAVMQTIGASGPEVVIHAAAMTDVDGCETDPDRAYAINALGSRNVSMAAGDALVCYVSTDYVFDGTAGPYREWDQTNPLSVYGASKLAGEREVASCASNWMIVRTSWVYSAGGRNFLRTMLKLADEKESIDVVDDQIGAPTYASDLAAVLVDLVRARRRGLFHATNAGEVSWYGFARAIFEEAGNDPERIKPVSSEAMKRPANRPKCSVLDNFAMRESGLKLMRPWRSALAECVAEIES